MASLFVPRTKNCGSSFDQPFLIWVCPLILAQTTDEAGPRWDLKTLYVVEMIRVSLPSAEGFVDFKNGFYSLVCNPRTRGRYPASSSTIRFRVLDTIAALLVSATHEPFNRISKTGQPLYERTI